MSDLSPEQIEAARAAGIIRDAQADALLARHREVEAAVSEAPLIGNEEDLRFLRSFSDIFITIGVVLLIVGIFIGASVLDPRESGWGAFGAAGLFWGLAEYFGRKRRAHLPTLVVTVAFALALGTGLAQFYADRLISLGGIGRDWFLPAALFLAGVALYYWRIRLPFVFMILGWGGVVFTFGVFGSLGLLPNLWAVVGLLFVCALAVLSAALLYDMRDPERVMRFSDNGFWLHTVASPLTLFSFMALGAKLTFGDKLTTLEGLSQIRDSADGLAYWMIGVIILSVLWGLAVNRRVFVISTLVYALVVIAYLLSQVELDPTLVSSVGLLIVGSVVVLLGVAWHAARGGLLKLLPGWPIFPRPTRTDL